MLPDDWKLPYPLPLLPSELKAKEEAQRKLMAKVAKVKAAKPTPLKVIKGQVLAQFGLSSTADLKKILVAKGIKLNLSRRDSWEPLLDQANGTRWVVEQELKRRINKPEAIARIEAKREELKLNFKYRVGIPLEELQQMNQQAAEFIREKQQRAA